MADGCNYMNQHGKSVSLCEPLKEWTTLYVYRKYICIYSISNIISEYNFHIDLKYSGILSLLPPLLNMHIHWEMSAVT